MAKLDKYNTIQQVESALDKAKSSMQIKNVDENGIYICDGQGAAILRIDILDSLSIGDNLKSAIISAIGSSSNLIKGTAEDGFFICNEDGDVLDRWDETLSYKNGCVTKRGNMASGDKWVLTKNSVKNGQRLSFSAKIGTFGSITIGHGYITDNETTWIDINQSNVVWHRVNSAGTEASGYPKTTPHNLDIKNNIQIEIVQTSNQAKLKVVSNGYIKEITDYWFGTNGDVYAISNSTLTNVSFGWTSNVIESGLWLFGDSYFSIADTSRWTSYLFADGFSKFLLNAYPGAGCNSGLNDLKELMKITTPKVVVWCLGMNNPDSSSVNVSWKSTFDQVKSICALNKIELILATIPSALGGANPDTPSAGSLQYQHKFKNEIVKSSGYRYIDFHSAVGSNDTTLVWYNNGQEDDMLESGSSRIHPTSYGALALYHQALADCPELMK